MTQPHSSPDSCLAAGRMLNTSASARDIIAREATVMLSDLQAPVSLCLFAQISIRSQSCRQPTR